MQPDRFRLKIYILIFLAVLTSSTVVISISENISIFDALYYCIVTVSTVGYGDISPTTVIGKSIAMVLIIVGVGTFLSVVGTITEIFFKREERKKLDKKIHILLGLTFSELGNKLLHKVKELDSNLDETKKILTFDKQHNSKSYRKISKQIYSLKVKPKTGDLEFELIYELISEKKDFLMRLLENPVLLEGDELTELIRNIFHLYEEFTYRLHIDDLSKSDIEHLNHDVVKVYKGLLATWVLYMEYLHVNYPVLHKFNRTKGPLNEV